ncbi:hypothetical protein K438DRAFT_1832839 [Mycena galopus ATCC 62051]|nr:hypothetical protein K438DRAFT_1832839 [Mycena galopus ATCC 62051]
MDLGGHQLDLAGNQHEFINCPGEGCNERIPSLLICGGRRVPWHRGLRYQACSECNWFKWLDPDLHAVAARRARDAPANGAPPFIPPPPPSDPWSCSPPLPGAEFAVDPALLVPPSHPPPPSPFPPPPSQPYPSTQAPAKPKCPGCRKRLATARDCSWQRCKTCCEQQGLGCRYSGHRTQRTASAPVSASDGDPSQLSRPPPMFAYAATSSAAEPTPDTVEPPSGSLPPKIYKKAMAPEWAERYKTAHEEREKRKIAEDERRKQDLAFERQVQVCCWTEDGEEPVWAREQGIMTFPKLNLVNHLSLLKKLGLTATDQLSIYNHDGKFFQVEDVDHVTQITARHVILARYVSVKRCPRLDEFIDKYSPKAVVTGPSRRALPLTSKRKSDATAFPASLKTPRLTTAIDLARPRSPSPHSASSVSPFPFSPSPSFASSPPSSPASTRPPSPFSMPCPILSIPLPATPQPQPSLTSPPLDPDSLWAAGRVLVPTLPQTWPEGIYARDMAAAFRIAGSNSKVKVADRFGAVFQAHVPLHERKFPKGAWYQQQSCWDLCQQEERDAAVQLPCTSDGLWTTWRAASSGWAQVMAKKRR